MGDVERAQQELGRRLGMARRLDRLRQAERGGRRDIVALEQRQRMGDVDLVRLEQRDLDQVEAVARGLGDAELRAFVVQALAHRLECMPKRIMLSP